MFWSNWFKEKNEQEVCLISETNRIIDGRLPAGILHIQNDDTAEAWGLDSTLQCRDEKTGRYIQFISSVICDPLDIYGGSNLNQTDVALVAAQTEDKEMTFLDRNTTKGSQLLWVGIITAMLTLGMLVFAFLRWKAG